MGKFYEAAYKEFSNRYGISHNLYSQYTNAMAIEQIGDFDADVNKDQVAKNTYLHTLYSALTAYLAKKTEYKVGESYDMSNLPLGKFIEDFDKVMEAINADENEKHTHYAGLTLTQVAEETWRRVDSFSKPLHKIWGRQIRNGTLSIEELQMKAGLSKAVIDLLRKNGAFGSLTETNQLSFF